MRSGARVVTFLVVSLLAFRTLTFAQSATTSLRGTVYDAKGLVVAGASVTLNNAATGFSRTTKTDSEGVYQFIELPPAGYVLTAEAPGFTKLKRENVVLQVSSPATLNLTLQVQGSSVVVDVKDEPPLINTQDASQGHVFGTNQLIELPSEGRDPVSILSLQPGVTFIGNNVDTTNDSRGGAVNGARSDQTNVTWDGLDNNDQLNGFAFQGALRATLDSLQEFRVTTTNSNADAGRSSGAQVNLVTKSGTNRVHGSLYEYNRNAFTAANDWFNKQAQIRQGLPNVPGQLIRNTFGASIGGPIKKDRVFYFATYEGQRTRETDQTTRTVPSDNLRNGIMSYRCDQTDPSCDPSINPQVTAGAGGSLVMTLTQSQFAQMDPNAASNGQCPWADVNGNCGADPNALAVFQTYPHPNTDAAGDGLDYRGYTFPGLHPRKLDTYIVKLDFKLDSQGKHTLFVRGNLQNDHESLPPQFDQPTVQPPSLFLTNNSKGIAVGYTTLLSATLINNFRYAFIRQGTGQGGLSASDLADFRGLDDPTAFSRTILTNVPVHNFVDDFTWIKGKHTIQFGTNQRFISNNRQSNAQNFSSAITNVFWLDNAGIANTGSSLDPAAFGFPAVDSTFGTDYDFATAAMAGLLTQVNSVFNQDKHGVLAAPGALISRHFRNWEGEWYLQDAWRIKPNLTITGGLRYSLLQTPYETHGEQAAPSFSMHDWFNTRSADMVQGISTHPEISFNLSGPANGGKPYWGWDYKNLAPRLALAYSPNFEKGFLHSIFGGNGKSSIRLGYGIYFDHFGEGVVNSFDRNGEFGLTTAVINPAGFQDVDTTARFSGLTTIPTSSAASGCPSLVPNFTPGFPYTPSNDPCFGFAIAWGLDDKLKTPYSHVFDFAITRELPNHLVIEASYIGRLGRRLLQESDLAMPLNLVDPASKTDYFSAATQLSKAALAGTDINSLAPIPYWEHLFPGAAGNLGFGPPGSSGNLGCAPGDNLSATNYTATQAMYDMYSCFVGNETTALFLADLLCLPACSSVTGGQPFAYWDDQFSSLYAWRSQGNSSYHAMQLSLRRPMSNGLQFDFNYTFSKSIDVGSNAERVNIFETNFGGFGDQVINSWSPNQLRAVSDFDTKHQINANWVWEIPVGRGHRFGGGMGKVANAVFGGWGLSGLFHWTSGLPFSIVPGAGWPTNWELQGLAILNGNPGSVGVHRDANNDPNMFPDVNTAIGAFRNPFPGESGQRNELRGPGFFGIDTGLGKSWNVTERQKVELRWDVFNATNAVRFDAAASAINEALTDVGSFGKYQSTLTKPRVMQLSMRYSF